MELSCDNDVPRARHGATRMSSDFWNERPSSSTNENATVITASFLRLGRSYHASKFRLTALPTAASWLPDALSVTNSYLSVSPRRRRDDAAGGLLARDGVAVS